MRNLLMTALLFGAVPAAADTATLFRAGQFAAASAAGEREGTSGALVLAARAELSMAAFDSRTKDDAEVRLARARALANQALAKDPGNVTALVQKGIAVGYDAQLRSSPGGAKEARRLFETAVARAPRDALAQAALAGWHGNAVATLGRMMASIVLGAHREPAIQGFELSVKLDPLTPVNPVYYAFTLLALGDEGAPRATQLLTNAAALHPRDAFEALMRRHGLEVLQLLQHGDVRAAREAARRLQPFGQL